MKQSARMTYLQPYLASDKKIPYSKALVSSVSPLHFPHHGHLQ